MRTYVCQNHYDGCDAVFTADPATEPRCPECGQQPEALPQFVWGDTPTGERVPISWPAHWIRGEHHPDTFTCTKHQNSFNAYHHGECVWCRIHPTDVYYVNVYEVGQSFGGPEEGGWWFSTGTPHCDPSDPVTFRCDTLAAARRLQELLTDHAYPNTGNQYSVNGGEDYAVHIEPHEPRAWPTHRPHYC